nr:hypothetical protein [uncultured Flavobacterium sp.]
MKFLITILFMLSVTTVQSQELDKLYYMLGNDTWDFSLPYHYESDLKSRKMAFWIHESKLGKVYRFSEVTGLKFKKGKYKEECQNCHQIYKFINIPSFYKYGNFYDFTYSKVKEYYYGFGEVEVEKQQGFLKPSILKNITKLQMKSFLAGAYLDVGSIKGDTIKFEFHQALNQKLILIKDYINAIESPKFFNVIHREDEGEVYGPTLLLVPNKILLELFRNEEERKNAFMSSNGFNTLK